MKTDDRDTIIAMVTTKHVADSLKNIFKDKLKSLKGNTDLLKALDGPKLGATEALETPALKLN